MKSSKQDFPNPILKNKTSDYNSDCAFNLTIDQDGIGVDNRNIVIPVSYSLICKGIEEYITNEKAAVVVNVTSSSVSYRRLFFFKKQQSMKISIPKFSVDNCIELQAAIVATERIKDFKCEEFNPIFFGDTDFDLRKGDYIAVDEIQRVYIDTSELEKPISSIFDINNCLEQENDIETDFENEKIQINLSGRLFKEYYEFKNYNNGALRRYITSIIVYPVLVEAVSKVSEYHAGNTDDDYSDKRWFRAIEKKIEEKMPEIDLNDPLDSLTLVGNNLLDNIAYDALISFRDSLENENNGETFIIGGID